MCKAVYTLLMVFFCIIFSSNIILADPFSDVPADHWAYDAVQMLEEKGLVEGYPDGLFKGDRPMTRYEMAMVVARVVAKLEQVQASIPEIPDLSIYATKEDMAALNRLLEEFREELDALGVRVANIEDSLGKLSSRVEELERVFIEGEFMSIANGVGFTEGSELGNDPNIYLYEDYGGYLMSQGFALSSKLNLNVGLNISENTRAGGIFTAYSSLGDSRVTYAWGIIPTYNPVGFGADDIYMDGINYRGNLNNLWFEHSNDWLDLNMGFGEFYPEKVSPLIYYGIVSPAYWSDATLPVYGIQAKGNLFENGKFELFQANDLTWTDYGPYPVWTPSSLSDPTLAPNPYDLWASDYYQNNGYHNRMLGALGGYETENLDFDVTYLRIYEDRASRPGSLLIPKEEKIFGFRASYQVVEEKLKLFGEFNTSWFDYDLLDNTFDNETGTALIIGGEGEFSSFFYKGQFLRIDGNYEPFNFRQIFEFRYHPDYLLGEGLYMPSIYRPNRIGLNMLLGYRFDEERGVVDGEFSYFTQIDPVDSSTGNLETTIGSRFGFQDHNFVNDSTDKGSELFFNIGGTYNITDAFSVEGRYFYFNFQRDYTTYKHDLTRHFIHLAASYYITDAFRISGIYDLAKVDGLSDDNINWDTTLHIPGVSLAYEFNEDTSVGLDYRHYTFSDNLNVDPTVITDYNANRISTWMQLSF